jgi:hypothetical protein
MLNLNLKIPIKRSRQIFKIAKKKVRHEFFYNIKRWLQITL